jgi:hypothetical protein
MALLIHKMKKIYFITIGKEKTCFQGKNIGPPRLPPSSLQMKAWYFVDTCHLVKAR